MRVTHISILHRALDTRIFAKQCRALAAAGYEVHLVAGGPSTSERDGVHLHSIADTDARPPARRQVKRLVRATSAAFSLRPSLYHLHDPHLIPLGLVLKLCGARVVYDVHEDYPAHARTKLADRPLRGSLKALMWGAGEQLARHALDAFSARRRRSPKGSRPTEPSWSATCLCIANTHPRRMVRRAHTGSGRTRSCTSARSPGSAVSGRWCKRSSCSRPGSTARCAWSARAATPTSRAPPHDLRSAEG